MALTVESGTSFPLGATVRDGGANFCLYARGATAVELLLFDTPDSPQPNASISLDPDKNRIFHYWHIFIPGISA
ncbi:glycogen debranching enzyme, partial [Leptolyngbya cf. ectocarpi LEGE 11479]|nr:glycogen debranching enzyme [Leptolyngbya cf. ectocarpi LEGE 11479]